MSKKLHPTYPPTCNKLTFIDKLSVMFGIIYIVPMAPLSREQFGVGIPAQLLPRGGLHGKKRDCVIHLERHYTCTSNPCMSNITIISISSIISMSDYCWYYHVY